MKKNFYAMTCIILVLGLFSASCHKDNLKPASQSIKQGGATSSSSDGNGTANYTEEVPGSHPSCPNSGEHH